MSAEFSILCIHCTVQRLLPQTGAYIYWGCPLSSVMMVFLAQLAVGGGCSSTPLQQAEARFNATRPALSNGQKNGDPYDSIEDAMHPTIHI